MRKPTKPSPTESPLLFEIDPQPLEETLTALGGIPLVVQAFRSLGLLQSVKDHVRVKEQECDYDEATFVESFVVLNAAGGECPEDFWRLRGDPGLAEMVGHELPLPAAARQFLYAFHEDEKIEEAKQRRLPQQSGWHWRRGSRRRWGKTSPGEKGRNIPSVRASLRVRPAHRDERRSDPRREEWLLIEWPKGEAEPTKYWLSTLPAETPLRDLVFLAKLRWIIERDCEELKQELGLGHFEVGGWRGFHHHATLCIAAYGFRVAERSCFSPSARAGQLELSLPQIPPDFRPRGAARAQRAATSVVNRNVAHDDRANFAATS